MFLVSHSLDTRAKEIRSWLPKHPSIALVIAAVYFEWAICRALIGLSKRPNKQLREDLKDYHGLEAYKDLWRDELQHLDGAQRLPEVVSDWQAVKSAFNARNVLVHGRDRYTPKMATPHVETLLAAVADICAFTVENGVDINQRLPQRRVKTEKKTL